jgi:hypothetical protein
VANSFPLRHSERARLAFWAYPEAKRKRFLLFLHILGFKVRIQLFCAVVNGTDLWVGHYVILALSMFEAEIGISGCPIGTTLPNSNKHTGSGDAVEMHLAITLLVFVSSAGKNCMPTAQLYPAVAGFGSGNSVVLLRMDIQVFWNVQCLLL